MKKRPYLKDVIIEEKLPWFIALEGKPLNYLYFSAANAKLVLMSSFLSLGSPMLSFPDIILEELNEKTK